MPGVLVQAALAGRPRTRLHVALRQVPARARAHRHLQPLVLRRGLGRARASRGPQTPAAACVGRRQENLGSAARRHRAFRGLPHPAGDDHPQVLFARVARRAEKPIHAAPGTAAQALEVLCRRHPRARLLGRLHARLRGSNPRHRDAASTLVRRARGQQVVHPAHRLSRDRGSGRESRLELPEDRCGKEEGACRGAGSACAREVSPMTEIKLPQDAARQGGASSYASFLYRQLPHTVVLVLAISGVAYTNISHQPLVGYWEFLTLAMAVVCVVTEWVKVDDRQARWQLILKHWGAILIAMNIMLLAGVQQFMPAPATGLVLLMLLALGAFLAGLNLSSLQICFLGIAMAIAVPAIAWLKQFALFLLLGAVLLVGLGLTFWPRRQGNERAAGAGDKET